MGEISDRIRYILEVENISYSQFAEKIGVASSAVSHFVNKRNKPSLDAITGILKAFPRISPDWFLFGEGSPYRLSTQQTSESSFPNGHGQIKKSESSKFARSEAHTIPIGMTKTNDAAYDTETRLQTITTPEKEENNKTEKEIEQSPRVLLLYPDGTFEIFNRTTKEKNHA